MTFCLVLLCSAPMSGVILETLNVRKLVAFGFALFTAQIIFFLIGGLIAPSPHTNDQILMTKCVDRESISDRWFFMRPRSSNYSCKEFLPEGDLDKVVPSDVKAAQIVFMAQFPHPREGVQLRMTRWFQQLIAVLMLDVKYKSQFEMRPEAQITFDVRLGYRNHGDSDHDWKEIAYSRETRPLKCTLDPAATRHQGHDHPIGDGFYYDCEVLPLFTLGSCHYDHYLVNLRIPVDTKKGTNTDIGMLQDVWMVEIHQNGGFTKVWFSLKTVVFPATLAALIFFWNRVRELSRQPNLLERTIFALGLVLSCLNCPIEWLSLM
ncbi:unnamed protein product [Protopolystoma xenopodis]|uniref:Protein wntless n=1 Tax=Protopolystoma xenopodis TaxID=117903 RepID=A0A448WUE5_9PLAT|nr:unnamed protein product [Protopolystoma xenopodis]